MRRVLHFEEAKQAPKISFEISFAIWQHTMQIAPNLIDLGDLHVVPAIPQPSLLRFLAQIAEGTLACVGMLCLMSKASQRI